MYSSNGTASALAKRALRMMGEEVPRRIPPGVANWKTREVQTWLQQVGFSSFCDRFQVGDADGRANVVLPNRTLTPPSPFTLVRRSSRWTETSS